MIPVIVTGLRTQERLVVNFDASEYAKFLDLPWKMGNSPILYFCCLPRKGLSIKAICPEGAMSIKPRVAGLIDIAPSGQMALIDSPFGAKKITAESN
uniref:Uncharacterized protein n=1 Tax=Candidatus Kentrum sp. MB TaxID=2138164 RepID=A0A451BBI2_9GAMM|nr:MAG: hypothetical protein BECKMB1821G_GA0114241_102822 [Candidatus Kentron sp. MB]VFK32056.1 MAG: hypothetical protein BECKMB1821I_GA0114274_102921 [Candidatus Kentron sp. MB]VFK75663.1 MAG: hypothetical protein BECKMB1821H_GA0114242_102827 [Candidatus Kentron sp. MB]